MCLHAGLIAGRKRRASVTAEKSAPKRTRESTHTRGSTADVQTRAVLAAEGDFVDRLRLYQQNARRPRSRSRSRASAFASISSSASAAAASGTAASLPAAAAPSTPSAAAAPSSSSSSAPPPSAAVRHQVTDVFAGVHNVGDYVQPIDIPFAEWNSCGSVAWSRTVQRHIIDHSIAVVNIPMEYNPLFGFVSYPLLAGGRFGCVMQPFRPVRLTSAPLSYRSFKSVAAVAQDIPATDAEYNKILLAKEAPPFYYLTDVDVELWADTAAAASHPLSPETLVRSEWSLLRVLPEAERTSFPGLTSPLAYVKTGLQAFTYHPEQGLYPFIHRIDFGKLQRMIVMRQASIVHCVRTRPGTVVLRSSRAAHSSRRRDQAVRNRTRGTQTSEWLVCLPGSAWLRICNISSITTDDEWVADILTRSKRVHPTSEVLLKAGTSHSYGIWKCVLNWPFVDRRYSPSASATITRTGRPWPRGCRPLRTFDERDSTRGGSRIYRRVLVVIWNRWMHRICDVRRSSPQSYPRWIIVLIIGVIIGVIVGVVLILVIIICGTGALTGGIDVERNVDHCTEESIRNITCIRARYARVCDP